MWSCPASPASPFLLLFQPGSAASKVDFRPGWGWSQTVAHGSSFSSILFCGAVRSTAVQPYSRIVMSCRMSIAWRHSGFWVCLIFAAAYSMSWIWAFTRIFDLDYRRRSPSVCLSAWPVAMPSTWPRPFSILSAPAALAMMMLLSACWWLRSARTLSLWPEMDWRQCSSSFGSSAAALSACTWSPAPSILVPDSLNRWMNDYLIISMSSDVAHYHLIFSWISTSMMSSSGLLVLYFEMHRGSSSGSPISACSNGLVQSSFACSLLWLRMFCLLFWNYVRLPSFADSDYLLLLLAPYLSCPSSCLFGGCSEFLDAAAATRISVLQVSGLATSGCLGSVAVAFWVFAAVLTSSTPWWLQLLSDCWLSLALEPSMVDRNSRILKPFAYELLALPDSLENLLASSPSKPQVPNLVSAQSDPDSNRRLCQSCQVFYDWWGLTAAPAQRTSTTWLAMKKTYYNFVLNIYL